MIMQSEQQLSWDLEEEILSLIQVKSLARFRSVCKRWNALLSDKRFINNLFVHVRPQFIVLSESKICSVDVNLDGPSIEVHNLPSYIPNYRRSMLMTVEYCNGLLIYVTCNGIGICNPWLRQIRWIKTKNQYSDFNGMGYDSSRPDSHYKIFNSHQTNTTTLKADITEFGSNACKSYEFSNDNWDLSMSYYSISLNGSLYWVAFNDESQKHFIQSFYFSTERFKPYCALPSKNSGREDVRSLAIFRGDRFSFLEQNCDTRNIEIWVTREKIKDGNGKTVEWMNFMSVSVSKWSSLAVSNHPPSYFIDNKSLSLILCCFNKEGKAFIYIAKGDNFHEIKIDALVDDYPRHCTYLPSLVPVPTFGKGKNQRVDSRFTFPKGIQAWDGVGGNEWDDGFFNDVKKIYVGRKNSVAVFVKFHYSKDNAIVAGAPHGNAAHIPDHEYLIADDNYIEAVEGTYTESHITSITFRMHKRNTTRQYGLFNGMPFVLGGGRGSKIIGFYGKSSNVHLTALGVHFSTSI